MWSFVAEYRKICGYCQLISESLGIQVALEEGGIEAAITKITACKTNLQLALLMNTTRTIDGTAGDTRNFAINFQRLTYENSPAAWTVEFRLREGLETFEDVTEWLGFIPGLLKYGVRSTV